MMESTALGAAIVAGRALRVWPTSTPSPPADTFIPATTSEERDIRRVRWEEALSKCLAWTSDGSEEKEKLCPDETDRTTAVIPPGLFFIGTALLVIIADKLKVI